MNNNFCNSKINKIEDAISYICNFEYCNFLSMPNVVGVGLGYKCVNGMMTYEKCITVFVTKKVPEFMLGCNRVIPKKYRGITTDVVESGEFQELKLISRERPVPGGYSISNELSISAGTMACLVKDANNDYYILSNNHVLALGNNAPLGSRIVQPGRMDGGMVDRDTVATLSNFVELKYETPGSTEENEADCAIAKVLDKSLVTSMIAQVGVPQGTIAPTLGMPVLKVGKSTEKTTGIIINTSATLTVPTRRGKLLYKNQIATNVRGDGGDSGALLLDMNNNAVGLMFIGTPTGLSAHNPIDIVLSRLGVSLVTQNNF